MVTPGIDAPTPTRVNHELHNGQQLLVRYRVRDGIQVAVTSEASTTQEQALAIEAKPATIETAVVAEATPEADSEAKPEAEPAAEPLPQFIKAYPTLLTAFLKHQLAAPGRVYLLMRALDSNGRGWLDVAQLRYRLTHNASTWHVCGWRRLRQILQQGEGVLWQRDGNGRIWLYNPARILMKLENGRLQGRPVAMPIKPLLGGIQQVRAHFYASFHSGRKRSNPISRITLAAATGVQTEASQRTYEKVARIKKQFNMAVGERYNKTHSEARGWHHGTAVFDFIDHHGRQGPEKRHYIAWQLPNSYEGSHQQVARGRQKKLNQQIDLVTQQARGNGLRGRLFYGDGAKAARAYNRAQGAYDNYWRSERGRRQPRQQLWYCLTALEGGDWLR